MVTMESQKKFPKFNWDYDVPETPFWEDLPFTTARNFLSCYSEDELSAMSFPDEMEKNEKWKLLLSRLQQKYNDLERQHAPTPFHEADYRTWNRVKLGIYTMYSELKQYDNAQSILFEMSEHGSYNGKMEAKNMLAGMYGELGRYSEAETMGRECLTWLREMDGIGPNSPQAMGTERRLMAAIWKQGKYEEARAMQEEMQGLVESLSGSKFEKYQDEEAKMLKDLIAELDQWKLEQAEKGAGA